jgi:phosphoglycolate phosphatase-like HAD superfamily hydrolase
VTNHHSAPIIIAFDLDGTLIDSLLPTASSLREALNAHGWKPLPDDAEVAAHFVGPDLRLALSRYYSCPEDSTTGVIQSFRVGMRSAIPRLSCFDGVKTALELLSRRAPPPILVVITNRLQRFAESILASVDIAQFFVRVVGIDEGAEATAAAAGRRDKSERLRIVIVDIGGGSSVDVVVVGDRAEDALMASGVGALFFRACWGYGADSEFDGVKVDFNLQAPIQIIDAAPPARRT